MTLKYRLITAVAASVLTLSACNQEVKPETEKPVQAMPVISAELSPVNDRLTAYEALFRSGTVSETYDYIPPALQTVIVGSTGVSEDIIRADIGEQWITALKTVSLEDIKFDLSNVEIQTSALDRDFVLIPTKMVMGVNANPEKVIVAKSTTVALKDDGEWYFARLDEPSMLELFKYAYPDLGLTVIPEAEMKMIDREPAQ